MINDLQEAKTFFAKDSYATDLSAIVLLSAERGFARCMFNTTEYHLNSDGVVQGGAIFTLADFTFAVAANFKNAHTVTMSSNINYLTPSRASQIYAEAELVREGRICLYSINVTDSDGKKVAYATFTGIRLEDKK